MQTHNILFLSHGGGPLPLLGDDGHRELVATLQKITTKIAKPAAIIVISAHWEAPEATVTHAAHPSLIYDYSGFPEESYSIEYPAAGNPELAKQVFSLIQEHGINAELNEKRGFDHGMFVPLKIMYPDADIPCIQVSLLKGLDPLQHIKLGKALAGLQTENLLVIGSGFSFHNLQAFFTPATHETKEMNQAFENWLIETCSNKQLDEATRTDRLVNWEHAPAARYCHPREEHLLPLHVCYGVSQAPCKEFFTLDIMGKKASMYLW